MENEQEFNKGQSEDKKVEEREVVGNKLEVNREQKWGDRLRKGRKKI